MSDRRILRAAVCVAVLLSAGLARASQVELVTRRHPSFDSSEVVGVAQESVISADGRWIAFTSTSPNLVPGQSDGNNNTDVFLLDRLSGDLTLVSHAAGFPATTGVGVSYDLSISADGRYLVFQSTSHNLAPGQMVTFPADRVYLYDRVADTLTRIVNGNNASKNPVISKDGSYIAFASAATDLIPGITDANGKEDVFLYERATGTLTLVSRSAASGSTAANGKSSSPQINADGSFVLYTSEATDMVAGQTEGNIGDDVFLYSRGAGTNTLVSHVQGLPATTGNQPASFGSLGLSDDAAYAVFISGATNLISGQIDSPSLWFDAFLYERATGNVTLLSHRDGSPVTASGTGQVSISADGAWITFDSSGVDLVPGQVDLNGFPDVFLVQRATGAVTLVSRQSGTASTAGDDLSTTGVLSEDGRYLLFSSYATNLIPGQTDTNEAGDTFLFDRVAGTSMLVSHADGSSSAAGNGWSGFSQLAGDGSYAAFLSTSSDLTADTDANGGNDLFVFSRSDGSNTAVSLSEPVVRVTPSEGGLGVPSRDGRFFVLQSQATDLVEGQSDAPGSDDVFLIDRLLGTTTLVSHASGSPATPANQESFAPWISADGKWVAFMSTATDLIPGIGQPSGFPKDNIFLYSRESGTLSLVSRNAATGLSANGGSTTPLISGDGRYVSFYSTATNLVSGQIDTSGFSGYDVFLHDRVTGTTALVSHAAGNPLQATNGGGGGGQSHWVSLDGRYVVFSSNAVNLVSGQTDTNGASDFFLYDRVTAAVTLVTHAAGSATATANGPAVPGLPALSADGRYFAYLSAATDLVPGQVDTNNNPDLFLFDRVTGTNTLVSRKAGTTATTGNGGCFAVAWISDDGRYVAFSCFSIDLVPGQIDLNQALDAFLYDRVTGTVALLSADGVSTDPNASTFAAALSPDGRFVAFSSQETARIPGQADQNGRGEDLFVMDRLAGTTRLASRSPLSPQTTANHTSGPRWFGSGGHLLFMLSSATDFVAGDYNMASDIYVYSAGSTPATDFYTLTPCRVADTRSTAILASDAKALFDFHGVCGIPATARAVALNVTILQGSAAGYLTLYPGDVEPPYASAVSFKAGQTRANNAILPLAYDGTGTLAALPALAGGGTVHLILDVVGWFE
ncbi:MAG TPA: hypothetical protein VFR31_23265 [Thermoanaerobaculia bacterium]|nr:hypothetical protein [Thermoanaerobaculia bacterium]